MKKTFLIFTILIISILITGCSHNKTVEQEIDLSVTETTTEPLIVEPIPTPADYEYTTDLIDVNNGNATGTVYAKQKDNNYMLYATFENLPKLNDDFFYEGWIVRKSPLSVLSTGKTFIEDGQHQNNFLAEGDLTDHDFYVLTLEPNDGDPAPADHILEGTLSK
jgi:hypothetical protein